MGRQECVIVSSDKIILGPMSTQYCEHGYLFTRHEKNRGTGLQKGCHQKYGMRRQELLFMDKKGLFDEV
jgi:hypothetical protein